MKNLSVYWFIILLILINQNSYSQNIGDLKGIYYQAVAIDEDGKEIVGMDIEGRPLNEKAIGVKFAITKGLEGPIYYEEVHTTTTDKYGLFSLIIGMGENTDGTYDHLMQIPWIDADQFLKVEISIKNDGNYRLVSNQQFMSVPYSFYTNDIADDAITTEKIRNYTILNEDIATGAIDTRTILDETILNEDIADGTIDLTTKVTGVLPVEHGGTGGASLTYDDLLIGGGDDPIRTLPVTDDIMILTNFDEGKTELYSLVAGLRVSFTINSDDKTVIITAADQSSGPGTGVGQNINFGIIASGEQSVRHFPIAGVEMNDIILASVEVDLQGLTMTAYVQQDGHVEVVLFNGSNVAVNVGVIDVAIANFGKP